MHILFLALHQDHPKSEDRRHSDWQESQHAQNRTVRSCDSESLGSSSSGQEHPVPEAHLQCTRQGTIFLCQHHRTKVSRYSSEIYSPNSLHSVWLWLSARDFYHCHWQTCNRRGGDPVTHVLFAAECVPDAPVFLLLLCAVFPQHSRQVTGSRTCPFLRPKTGKIFADERR